MMPETETETKSALNEEDVIAWLKTHPDFLRRNPDICDFLEPPKVSGGKGVVDFQDYMIKRLKTDRKEVIETAQEIVETSRANMNNQTRMHRAVLLLLEAQNFEDFVRTITMDLPGILDIDIVTLLVEAEGTAIPHLNISGVRAVAPGTIVLMMEDRSIALSGSIAGIDEIYGGGAGLVKSQALLLLAIAPDAPPAMLAFGSRDPGMFEDGQGTELVSFLGYVIERCLRSWLDLPPL